jgi:hypothetical protein
MSFGLDPNETHSDIDHAIRTAFHADKIMFASAANHGALKPRAFPACRDEVICIHACNGKGKDIGINPDPWPKQYNFTTLGASIQSRWKRNWVYKTGTSFATPIAVACVANALEFARHKCDLSEDTYKLLFRRDRVMRILELMSSPLGGYDFIYPPRLWDGHRDLTIPETLTRIAHGRPLVYTVV